MTVTTNPFEANPFAGGQADSFESPVDEGDPFSDPTEIRSEFPKVDDLRGRLLLIRPTKLEKGVVSKHLPLNNGQPVIQDRVTVDVYVLDGPPLDAFGGETAFEGMYMSQNRLIQQLSSCRGIGGNGPAMVLGRLDTYKPGQRAGFGNPWGLKDPTEGDKNTARAYLRMRQSS